MLKRGIRKWDLFFLIINGVIGAGIFALPAKVFALSGAYSLLAFGVCALMMLVLILVFAEVSSRFEKTGGPYLYVHAAFGPVPAFIIGWLLLLTRLFSYATLINLMVLYLSFFSDVFMEASIRIAMILGITFALTLLNWIGVRSSARVGNVLTVAKLFPLAIFIIVGLFFLDTDLINFAERPDLTAFSASTLLLIFAFGGFESGLVNSGEIENPRKNLPFALIAATLVITLFYVLIQLVSIGTLPELAQSDKPIADAAQGFMGWGGGLLITLGAVVSILGTLNVQVLSGSRMPFALSEEGQFPQIFSRVHPKFATPVVSLLFFGILVGFVSVFWGFMSSLAISVISRLLMYILVCAALIRLRQIHPGKGYFRIPLGKFFAIFGILMSIWLLSGTDLLEIRDAALWTGLGLVIYAVHYFGKRRIR
ncbi:APC family permease [Pararhodonellum marinum]|uniref:APC family permease n=1 Tax=Pararhodonellum marinum TaxID=2755358 RepID=UPI00188E675D|nr:APC family permease [Pararhodonellum marinum]